MNSIPGPVLIPLVEQNPFDGNLPRSIDPHLKEMESKFPNEAQKHRDFWNLHSQIQSSYRSLTNGADPVVQYKNKSQENIVLRGDDKIRAFNQHRLAIINTTIQTLLRIRKDYNPNLFDLYELFLLAVDIRRYSIDVDKPETLKWIMLPEEEELSALPANTQDQIEFLYESLIKMDSPTLPDIKQIEIFISVVNILIRDLIKSMDETPTAIHNEA